MTEWETKGEAGETVSTHQHKDAIPATKAQTSPERGNAVHWALSSLPREGIFWIDDLETYFTCKP